MDDVKLRAIEAYVRYVDCTSVGALRGGGSVSSVATFSQWLGNVSEYRGSVYDSIVGDGSLVHSVVSGKYERGGLGCWCGSVLRRQGESVVEPDVEDGGSREPSSDGSSCDGEGRMVREGGMVVADNDLSASTVSSTASSPGVGVSGGSQVVTEGELLGVDSPAVKSKNARKKAGQRARRAAARAAGVGCVIASGVSSGTSGAGVEDCSGKKSYSFRDVTTAEEQKEFARSWFECKLAENKLHKQRADYNFKHNDYMLSSRIAEKKWECDRLRCEEKLANINRIRFGSKPGYAETLASLSDGSEKPPSLSTGSDSPASLSDGTVSPNSSMSVAEEYKLRKKLEEMSEEVAQLKLERAALTTSRACSGGKVVVEDGRVHVYDGTGQFVPPTPVYGSECALSMDDYPEELQRHCDFVY